MASTREPNPVEVRGVELFLNSQSRAITVLDNQAVRITRPHAVWKTHDAENVSSLDLLQRVPGCAEADRRMFDQSGSTKIPNKT
ncbi:hypothetical protein TNCV_2357831 [Trichonephila clavipes]|nr:hypothetical protein TNCV_2357831 [Trichonephila clavipes]